MIVIVMVGVCMSGRLQDSRGGRLEDRSGGLL